MLTVKCDCFECKTRARVRRYQLIFACIFYAAFCTLMAAIIVFDWSPF